MRDVTVIGAGPAGSVAALLLARGGWTVTLVEQHRFPRDKVCGECLSAVGIESLEQMGLAAGLRGLGPALLTHASICSRTGKPVRLALPRAMWGISRRVMDQFLLDAARAAGVRVWQPARCEHIQFDPIRLHVRDLQSNCIGTLEPGRVIVADGKGAMFAPSVRTDDFGIKAHFEGIDASDATIELFGCQGLYGGLAPIEGTRWNAAFSVPAARLRAHKGNVAALFSQITRENRMLGRRLAGSRRVSAWLASPLPRFGPGGDWPAGVVPAGNAAAAIEPIGGEGMGLAIRSAQLAARMLLDGTEEDSPQRQGDHGETGLLDQYRRVWNMRRLACRTAAMVVSRPALGGTLLPLLSVPAIRSMGLHFLGK